MTADTRGHRSMLKAAIICGVLLVVVIVIFAVPAQCQERGSSKGLRVALVAMGAGQTLDSVTTVQALSRGGVHETNALLGAHPSAAKLVAAKLPMVGVGWLLTKIAPTHPKLAQGTAYVIGGIGAGLALHNSRQGRR